MVDKELRRLSRLELLELLVAQSKEMEELQLKLDKAEERLATRELKIDKAGSIAEAVISLSEVLEAAEDAGRMYVDELEKLYEREKLICKSMENKAQAMQIGHGQGAVTGNEQRGS